MGTFLAQLVYCLKICYAQFGSQLTNFKMQKGKAVYETKNQTIVIRDVGIGSVCQPDAGLRHSRGLTEPGLR